MAEREFTNEEKAALKQRIIDARGYWSPFHDGLLELSPTYLEAYLAYQDAPARSGTVSARMIEFIYIAVDASVTHLYTTGLARHVARALELGATKAEVLEVIQLTMLTSHFSHEIGFAALADEMKARGIGGDSPADDEVVRRTKQAFAAATGAWPEAADTMFEVAQHLVQPYLAYASIPWKGGPLPAKDKALILLAVCASPTTRHASGVRENVRRALDHGATPSEIADVIHLASAISIHTCTAAIPAITGAG